MYSFFSLLFWVLSGAICAFIAKQRNRNPLIWFMIGMLFGVIGLIILFLLPPPKTKKLTPVSTAVSENSEIVFSKNNPIETFSTSLPHFPATPFWYYLDEENRQHGPMSWEALKKSWEEKVIDESTLVWNEEMEDWQPLKGLSHIFEKI